MTPTLAVFSFTLFFSSFLLFVIEPLMAKRVLPFLGGGPQVWNTCMLFYQLALLAGYVYAHAISERLKPRTQAVVHLALSGAAAAALFLIPVKSPLQPPNSPILWLLGYLTLSIGLPFFVLSANSPLLQRWFARKATGKDPYLLFTASNFGSFLALASYPFLIEPGIGLSHQAGLWRIAFLIFLSVLGGCAWAVSQTRQRVRESIPLAKAVLPRGRWIFLAFVPSSLMLGVTTYLTTDMAPVPLLWVVPLALYLLSFILVFTPSGQKLVAPCAAALLPLVVALFALVNVGPMWPLLALHLVTFFIAAIAIHGELARLRPPAERLTDYYICMVFGGALGGIFNAVVAPVIFNSVLEYPIALLFACAAALGSATRPSKSWQPRAIAGAAIVLACGIYLRHRSTHPGILAAPALAVVGILLVAGFMSRLNAYRRIWGCVLTVLLLYPVLAPVNRDRRLFTGRSFFGVYRITEDAEGKAHYFYHGRIRHGLQYQDPLLRLKPYSTYYDPTGPLGTILEKIQAFPGNKPIAVIGLGAGTMLAYARPHEPWDFYEIDPMVFRIASDPKLFTFLSSSSATWKVLLGDARLRLNEAPAQGYKAIFVDAFGSDAVPVHLLTREAIQLYLAKLAPNGWLVFHITNGYLDLLPPIGDVGKDQGLTVLAADDPGGIREGLPRPRSRWLVMSANRKSLSALAPPSTDSKPKGRVWTDDYSNLFSAVRWR